MISTESALHFAESGAASAPGELVLWRGRPGQAKTPLRTMILGGGVFFLALKELFFDLHVLFFKTFPSVERSLGASAVLAILVVFAILSDRRGRPPKLLRLTGHTGYTLTESALIVSRKNGTERFDRERFALLGDVTHFPAGRLSTTVFRMNAGGADAEPPIKLYGIQDPYRVVCLIRATLAPHTLARNIKGNEA